MRITTRASVILATIATLSLTVGTAYLWPAPEPPEIEHRTTGEDSINPDGHESPIRVHDVTPAPELEVQELLNVRGRTVAVLADGVAGLNYPDGTVGWIYRVPGHETTVDITTDRFSITATHSVPGRWFTERTRETVLSADTGKIIYQDDLSSRAPVAPEIAPSDLRILSDDTLKGQWRMPHAERHDWDKSKDYVWEVDPASWCKDNTDPEIETAGNDTGVHLSIACGDREGHLVQIDPYTGENLWEQEFVPVDGAPEILIIRNELRTGPENDPTIPATNGEYGPRHRYIDYLDGSSSFPTDLLENDGNQVFGGHLSVPSTDPDAPVEAFIIGTPSTIEAHLLHHGVQHLLDQGVLNPDDLGPDLFDDPEQHQFREPLDPLYFHEQQRNGLRSALEESTQ